MTQYYSNPTPMPNEGKTLSRQARRRVAARQRAHLANMTLCETCEGDGYAVEPNPCSDCHGTGFKRKDET